MRPVQPQESLIALLTDFGTRDPYVASMRGVLASRSVGRIENLTHEIGPFDVFEASAFLHGCLPWLPRQGARYERVVVCAVVDPGVGSDRSILIARSAGRLLIAPDNGLLVPLLRAEDEVFAFSGSRFDLTQVSSTFHGRDRIAPVAAALADGTEPDAIGARVALSELTPAPWWPPLERSAGSVTGTVIAIDRFGNCVTDVPAEDLCANSVAILPNGVRVSGRFDSYEAASGAGAFLIAGSRRSVELSVTQAGAADVLQILRGDRVRLERNE